jgi:hypothetical protein
MTTLYWKDSGLPVREMSEAAAWCAVARWPDHYFYYIGDSDEMYVDSFDPDFLKPGLTTDE